MDLPYPAIKTNIADSLDIIVRMERPPGTRFVSETLEIQAYDAKNDRYRLDRVYARDDGNPANKAAGGAKC